MISSSRTTCVFCLYLKMQKQNVKDIFKDVSTSLYCIWQLVFFFNSADFTFPVEKKSMRGLCHTTTEYKLNLFYDLSLNAVERNTTLLSMLLFRFKAAATCIKSWECYC